MGQLELFAKCCQLVGNKTSFTNIKLILIKLLKCLKYEEQVNKYRKNRF